MKTRFYQFGPFRMDCVNHSLLRDGKAVPLKPKVFDTLLLLVEERNRVLHKDDLMTRLWPDTIVEESNLTQNIYLLRKVLEEDSHQETYIKTIPKRGYRFVAKVTETADADGSFGEGAGLPATAGTNQTDVTSAPAQAKGRKLWLSEIPVRRSAIVVAVCLIAVLAATFFYFRNRAKFTTTNLASVRSIAVLPFKSLPGDAGSEMLRFGMTDNLIARLSTLKKITVLSTSAVRKFAAPDQDPLAAGRELKVDAVLDATILKSGDQTRVTLRLLSVNDGSSLWTRKIDQQTADTFALQDMVAEEVANALLPQLSGDERARITRRYTGNPEAYLLYMNGRYHWNKETNEDLRKAIGYYNQAIEKDRTYALAYTGLADAYTSIIADSLIPKAEAMPNARQAAQMALKLDDTVAEAHVAMARIKAYYDWDWQGSEVEFKRALELDPHSALAHQEYAFYLTYIGRSNEAVTEAFQARELDPVSKLANFNVAWALIFARRFDEAIAQSKQVSASFPEASYWIGVAYLGKGMNQEAISELEKAVSTLKNNLQAKSFLGYAYGVAGRRSEAENVLLEFNRLANDRPISPYYVALVQSGLGNKDQAFASLEAAYGEHSRLLGALKVGPAWDGLRSDSRFKDLLRRIGLSQ